MQVVLPIAAAVTVTVAILALSGVELTMFHLIALLLVVGVGSNYTLFFDRTVQQGVARERTFVSLVTCNLSTVLGFGLIGFASTPLLSAIGVTVSIGAALSLFFGAVFMQIEPGIVENPVTD
jgi:predicted exporter